MNLTTSKWQEWRYWNTLDKPGEATITYGEKMRHRCKLYLGWKNTGNRNHFHNRKYSEQIGSQRHWVYRRQAQQKVCIPLNPEGEGTKQRWTFRSTTDESDRSLVPACSWKGEIERAFDYGLARIKERAEAKPKFTEEITENHNHCD